MKVSPLLAAFAGAVVLLANACAAATPALVQARQQFCEFYLGSDARPEGNLDLRDTNETPPDLARAAADVRTLRPDGTWPDIDYASKARSGWPPAVHWTRILAIAAAERAHGARVDRAAFESAVHRAFAYWIQHDFICPNWWYNQIGIPKFAATTGLLLGEDLTAPEKTYLIGTLMPRAKIGMTGQNRVWLSGNTLMFALLEGDESLVATAATTIWSELAVTTQEGIQPDFSFHQHGPQQQFGNYGLALAVEICRWGSVLRGTPWALPADKLAAYRGFLLDGENWVIWDGWMDVSSCGRQLMPDAQRQKARTIAQVMRNVAVFDPAHAPAYEAFDRRNQPGASNDLVGNHVFWRSDYVIHRRPDFSVTLKLSSRRVVGAESLNTENLLGYHLADGALYLYGRGDEYADIFPVWDWQKLPGITCAQRKDGPPHFSAVRGERDFVGGVTDGANGCAALDFARDGVQAHKAWFFGPNAVVCLGNDIRHTGPEPVVTTINQCLLRGPVTLKQAGHDPVPFAGAEQIVADVEWVEHDGWRYSFATPTAVHLRANTQTGNWNRVFSNPDTPPADVSLKVFALWIEHAASGTGSYAYTVTPAGDAGAAARRGLNEASAAAHQSVRWDDHAGAAVFWAAGDAQVLPTMRIAVDHPCLVVADETAGRVFVSDPTHMLIKVTVTVNGVAHPVSLPRGGDAGKSVEVALKQP